MAKHTPAPWEAKLGEFDFTNDGGRPIMFGKKDSEDRKRVALVDSVLPRKRSTEYNAPDAERDANARLIAAAPELLSALNWALKHCADASGGPGWTEDDVKRFDIACDVVKKAA